MEGGDKNENQDEIQEKKKELVDTVDPGEQNKNQKEMQDENHEIIETVNTGELHFKHSFCHELSG